MICEKSNVNDFWDVQGIKSHNIHDAVQLELPNFEGNNLELAELMKSFMKATKFSDENDTFYTHREALEIIKERANAHVYQF